MKLHIAMGMVVVSLTAAIHSEETMQKVGIGVGVDIQAGGGDAYDDEEPNYVWIGPGWYGGYWFDNEVDFNYWGDRHGWGHHGWHGGHWHDGHGGGHHH